MYYECGKIFTKYTKKAPLATSRKLPNGAKFGELTEWFIMLILHVSGRYGQRPMGSNLILAGNESKGQAFA